MGETFPFILINDKFTARLQFDNKDFTKYYKQILYEIMFLKKKNTFTSQKYENEIN